MRRLRLFLLLVPLVVGMAALHTAESHWIGVAGQATPFATANAWMEGRVPGADDVVVLGADALGDMTITAPITIAGFQLDANSRTVVQVADVNCLGGFNLERGHWAVNASELLTITGDCMVGRKCSFLAAAGTVRMLGSHAVANRQSLNAFHILEVAGQVGDVVTLVDHVQVAGQCRIGAGMVQCKVLGDGETTTDIGYDLVLRGGGPTLVMNGGSIAGAWPNGGEVVYVADSSEPVLFGGMDYGGCRVQLEVLAGVQGQFDQIGGIDQCESLRTKVSPTDGARLQWYTHDHPVAVETSLLMDAALGMYARQRAHGATILHAGHSQFAIGKNFEWALPPEGNDAFYMEQATFSIQGNWHVVGTDAHIFPGTSTVVFTGERPRVSAPWWTYDASSLLFHNLVVDAGVLKFGAGSSARIFGDLDIQRGSVKGLVNSRIVIAGHQPQTCHWANSQLFHVAIANAAAPVTFLGGCRTTTGAHLTVGSGADLLFEAGQTFQFDGLHMDGSQVASTRLRSTAPGTAYHLTIRSESELVRYALIQDADASQGILLEARHSVDSGNNTHWLFTDTVHLMLASEWFSYTSPACIEGYVSPDAEQVRITYGNQSQTAARIQHHAWLSSPDQGSELPGIPLSAQAPTPITLHAENSADESVVVSTALEWRAVDLSAYGLNHLDVRAGDAVLVTVPSVDDAPEQVVYTAALGDAVQTFAAQRGDRLPIRLDEPGVWTIEVADAAGNPIGYTFSVTVFGIEGLDLPLADEIAYTRLVPVRITPADRAPEVRFGGVSGAVIRAVKDVADGEPGQRTFRLQVTRAERPLVIPRLGRDGPAFMIKPIDAFALDTSARYTIRELATSADGSKLMRAKFTMTPWVPGIDIHLKAVAPNVTFLNALPEITMSSDACTVDEQGNGTLYYHLIQTPNSRNRFCHSYAGFQRGIQVVPW